MANNPMMVMTTRLVYRSRVSTINVKPLWCSALAVAILIASVAPSAHIRAQDPVIPTGRLMFRASSLEFRPDGTFTLQDVLEGFGEVHVAGTWKQASGRVELSRFKSSRVSSCCKPCPFRSTAARTLASIDTR